MNCKCLQVALVTMHVLELDAYFNTITCIYVNADPTDYVSLTA